MFCRALAVEAGERLDFCRGDMRDKVDPYLRPLYDALYDTMPAEQVTRRLDSSEIEIAARVHAWPNLVERFRYFGRGAEHDTDADENVFNPLG